MSTFDDMKKFIAKKMQKNMVHLIPSVMPYLLDNLDSVFDSIKEKQKTIVLLEGEVDSVLMIFFDNEILYGAICAMNADDKVTRQIVCGPIKEMILEYAKNFKFQDDKPDNNKPKDVNLLLSHDADSDVKQLT